MLCMMSETLLLSLMKLLTLRVLSDAIVVLILDNKTHLAPQDCVCDPPNCSMESAELRKLFRLIVRRQNSQLLGSYIY